MRPIEIHQDRLILYGCGDFLNDYEGIGGFEEYRANLTLMYFATIDPQQGRLARLHLVPMHIRRCRLNRASESDSQWLCDVLNKLGARFGTQAFLDAGHRIAIRW